MLEISHLYKKYMNSERFSVEDLNLSLKPGEIFGLSWNGFAPGDPADFFLLDPGEIWIPGPDTLYSKSCNTPFSGQSLYGRVRHHWLGGVQLF